MELTSREIKDRLIFMESRNFDAYILKKDDSFRIGKLTIMSEDQYIINDRKIGEDPVTISEIKFLRRAS